MKKLLFLLFPIMLFAAEPRLPGNGPAVVTSPSEKVNGDSVRWNNTSKRWEAFAPGEGGGGSVFVNASEVTAPNFVNSSTMIFIVSSDTNVTGIASNIVNNLIAANAAISFSKLDPSGQVNNFSLWDASQASRTWTANLSGATDPVITYANNSITFTTGDIFVPNNASLPPPSFGTNPGQVGGFAPITVTSASANGTVHSQNANANGTSYFKVATPSDGANGITGSYVEIPSGTYVLFPGMSYNTTQVGNVGTGEDNLMTYAVPAGRLAANGDTIRFRVAGSFAANGNTKQVKVYFGATVIFASGAVAFNAGDWVVDCEVSRTGATAQIATTTWVGSNSSLTSGALITTPAETLANSITIKCTGEATSNDDITQKTFTARLVKTP